MSGLDFVEDELRELAAAGLLRSAAPACRLPGVLDFTSNDYLGLARRSVSRETLLRHAGIAAGAAASRLINGTHPQHDSLESALAQWLRTDAALLFSSGYAANIGVLSALAQAGDLIVSDSLNHASLIDGCRLSRATVRVVPHLDPLAVEQALSLPARRRYIVTESYYSMDADTPNLRRLRTLADSYNAALIVDEAHALGVFGPQGRGICAREGVTPDLLIGTLGKALGLHGAFVAGSAALRTYLWNRARSFVFSTAPLPLLASLATSHVLYARRANQARQHLAACAARLRSRLAPTPIAPPPTSHGPIIPLIVGTPAAALDAAQRLLARGIRVQPIRPPTVPHGTSRLRITLSAANTSAQVDRLADTLLQTCAP